MKSIWKFNIPIESKFAITMPKGTQIIAFQYQVITGKTFIWGIVELEVEPETRTFVILGTGFKFEDVPGTYIGTVQILDLVWHLFEKS